MEGRGAPGPADPKAAAATAADDTLLHGSLAVSGRSPYLIWPMTSLFVLALVFFAWPGPRPADPTGRSARNTPKRRFPRLPAGRLPPQAPDGCLHHGELRRCPTTSRPAARPIPRLRLRRASAAGLTGGRPPRRSRRTTWWVGGGVVGLLALGAGAWAALSFFQQGPQPAEALPASTVAYVGVDLDPSGGQKIDAFRTLNKFPAFKDKVGIHSTDDVRRKIGEAIIRSTGCDLTYDADIDPWLVTGPRSRRRPREPDARRRRGGPGQGRRQGREWPPPADHLRRPPVTDLGYDVHDGWAVLAQSQQVADTVVAKTKTGSLADDATYQKWTKAVGDSGVVNMYAAPAAGEFLAGRLNGLGSSLGGFGNSQYSTSDNFVLGQATTYSSDLTKALKNFHGAAATIRFTGDGLELATASDPGLSQSSVVSDQGGAVVSRLPDDTAAAFGIGLRSGWFTQVIGKVATAEGQTSQQLMSDLSEKSGLDLPGDVETLLGSSTTLSISKDFDFEAATNSSDGVGLPVALTMKGDPAAIGKVLDKIRAQAGWDAGSSVLASDSSGDLVAVGPTPAYRQSVLAGGHLGDTPAFRSVIPDAAHARHGLLRQRRRPREGPVAGRGGGDQQVASNVAPLQAFGFSAWMDGDIAPDVAEDQHELKRTADLDGTRDRRRPRRLSKRTTEPARS